MKNSFTFENIKIEVFRMQLHGVRVEQRGQTGHPSGKPLM